MKQKKPKIKTAKEAAAEILMLHTPMRTRKLGALYAALGLRANAEPKSHAEKVTDAFRSTWRDCYFLAGMLTLLPFLESNRRHSFQYEGEKILAEAHEFMNDCEWTTSAKRKLTVLSERIIKLKEKIEKEMTPRA